MPFKAAGTITGLYREDYGYNATAAAFDPYRDNWRESKPTVSRAGAESTDNNDDNYESRINRKKKGVN